ncbi:MAG: PDDEXK nuclease domain-containing protein [Deltaproteobacteria bacterium]
MIELVKNIEYQELIGKIGSVYQSAKIKIISAVNVEMLNAYWQIGKDIIEFEQNGKLKAEYGKQLLENLAKDLTLQYGKGFSRSNLNYMRLLYNKYPICETLSHKLSWSHYYELLKVDDDLARNFYEKHAITDNWTIRELRRQKKTGLYHRIAIGKDKEKILELSKQGQIVKSEEDFIKNPHVFEFMNFPENYEYNENDIEKAIINNLQHFLLELGKGFAFIGRQQRITLNNRHYFVDLVFYHVKLKCYVLIDLKIGEVAHEHIGQMKLYLGYYEKEVNDISDNEPIGLILSEEKDDIMVEYAMLKDTSKLIVSKYQLYLPDLEQLKNKVREIIEK